MAMRFDMFDLALFARIAETNNLTRAAHDMHVTPPSVSARIRNLEDSLGVKLLSRATHGVALTTPGQTFLRHARAMLQQAECLRAELQPHAGGGRGTVRILANTSAITEFLPPLLQPYLANHPDVDVDLREHLTCQIVEAVDKGAADIGLIVGSDPLAGLQTVPLWEDMLVLAVPASHDLASRSSVHFAETLAFDFVVLSGTSSIRSCVQRAATALQQPLRVQYQVSNHETACRIVEHRMGVSILPKSSALRHAASMNIRIVALADAWAVRHLQIAVRDLASKPGFVRELVDFLVHQSELEAA